MLITLLKKGGEKIRWKNRHLSNRLIKMLSTFFEAENPFHNMFQTTFIKVINNIHSI